jgi:hypothetical protein
MTVFFKVEISLKSVFIDSDFARKSSCKNANFPYNLYFSVR